MTKILLIEDDPLLSRMYSKVFSMNNFEHAEASDGVLGIEMAKSYHPDIILMDIMMPNLNGLEALEKIKKDEKLKHIPVVMLTNIEDEETKKNATELGASGYLVKSRNDPIETVSYIDDVLKGRVRL